MKRIEVVAAVLTDGIRFFCTQRGYGELKDKWEFPGGKIEPGETPEQALKREIREELATEITVGQLITTVEYDYPTFHLTMHTYLCDVVSGHLQLLEHENAGWFTLQEMQQLDWCPADIEVLDSLCKSKIRSSVMYDE